MNAAQRFKTALAQQALTVGTFVKTPSTMLAEVLALTDLDVCCLDAEHSPFDRGDIDGAILAFRANDKAVVVRIRDHSGPEILNALDCGASGIVVPHVDSPEVARSIVQKSFYGANGRGYAGSSRFAHYTHSPLADNLENNRRETSVIAQIEDLAALDCIDEIMAVDGIDCFFIGVMDLTVALGASHANDPKVTAAIDHIIAAANTHQRTLGMFVPDPKAVAQWQAKGVSLFLLNSDHGFIKQGANALVASVKSVN
jgi:2-keto-3-deoxy-L-rhamnonate aldolase RhmA